MTIELQRLRLWWENAFWVIPLAGIAIAFVLSQAVEQFDETIGDGQSRLLSVSSAQTLLSAIGGGMVTFTGFVFSVVLLIIQFGSSAYSPRTVTYFMRARSVQWVLATFLATITFSFLTLSSIGSGGREEFVPLLGVAAAILCLLVSLVGFLVLITVVSSRVRVDALLSSIGAMARRQLRRRHGAGAGRRAPARRALADAPASADAPGGADDCASADASERPDASEVAERLRYVGRPGQVVGIDARRLKRLVRRTGVHAQVLVRVGDGVSVGAPVVRVTGGAGHLSEGDVSRCLLVQRERSLKYDPLYALRILTDVSLKALSPAINDPTTAVRSLDEVEGVLRVAASLPLGPSVIEAGDGSVLLRGATWSDVVDLALLEVLEAGVQQPQVTRRVSALLADLLADLPDDQHGPLLRYRRRLTDEVASTHPLDRDVWLAEDPQGLGGSR